MRTQLANAAYDVLHGGSYPTVSILGGFPIASALYGAAVFSPYLLLPSWQRPEKTGRPCLSCTAICYEIEEGLQS
jgi:hypothetical protein